MTVVRELFVKLGIDFDEKTAKDAKQQTDSLFGSMTKGMGAVTGIISAGAIVGFMKEVVTAASDAAETTNLLKESFQGNQAAVESWASSFAENVGRSKYEMEKMAGTLGSVLTPLMDGNVNASADMSKKFSELAVDLGSFYNAADSDALAALRSGLTGEAEPLKRFGVIMNQDALDAYALAKGIKTSVKDMSIAEKTALRYNFILEKTSLASGDAARTADGFANMSKRAGSMLKDMATEAGKVVLPFFTKFLGHIASLLGRLKKFTQNTNLVKGAMVGLGAGLVALGVITAVAFAPALLAFGKLALAITAITLISTDLFNLFSGKQSVIGTLIDSLAGPGSASEAVAALISGFTVLKDVFIQYVIPYLKFVIAYWKTVFSVTFKFLRIVLTPMIAYVKIVMALFKLLGSVLKEVFGPAASGMSKWFSDIASSITKTLLPVLQKVGAYIDKIVNGIASAGDWVSGKISGLTGAGAPSVPKPAGAGAGGGGGGAPPVINQQNTVNMNGGSAGDGKAVAKEVGRQATKGTKTALNAVTHKAGG